MTDFQRAIACLPAPLRDRLQGVPAAVQDRVQETVCGPGRPVELSGGGRSLLLTQSGDVTELRRTSPYICDAALLAECFQALCEYSVHTHQQEIRRGFISTRTGCRAGIAGSAVTENGEILSMRADHLHLRRGGPAAYGCADPLLNRLLQGGRIAGALICGEPSSGKTSLLRDMARQLSDGLPGQAVSRGGGGRAGGAGRGPGTAGMRCAALLPQGEGDRAGGALPGARRGAVR